MVVAVLCSQIVLVVAYGIVTAILVFRIPRETSRLEHRKRYIVVDRVGGDLIVETQSNLLWRAKRAARREERWALGRIEVIDTRAEGYHGS